MSILNPFSWFTSYDTYSIEPIVGNNEMKQFDGSGSFYNFFHSRLYNANEVYLGNKVIGTYHINDNEFGQLIITPYIYSGYKIPTGSYFNYDITKEYYNDIIYDKQQIQPDPFNKNEFNNTNIKHTTNYGVDRSVNVNNNTNIATINNDALKVAGVEVKSYDVRHLELVMNAHSQDYLSVNAVLPIHYSYHFNNAPNVQLKNG